MRLWTLDPGYLDSAGLVALWREALLAQKVLRGRTEGYRHHPQLVRFRQTRDPVGAAASYLRAVYEEAVRRGYRFDRTRIAPGRARFRIEVGEGQLMWEWRHLKRKLRERSPGHLKVLRRVSRPRPHPLFVVVRGGIEDWERGAR